MDWLTEEWVSAEFTKALDSWVKKWHQCGIEQYVGTWFAKAAARKVVELIEKRFSPLPHSTVLEIYPDELQALKQEVGL